jgi:MSHA pilin protein MshA
MQDQHRRAYGGNLPVSPMRINRGFTMIELVIVIVILGVLAAVALPKFINLGRDARVSAVSAAKGAVTAAANNAFVKCQLKQGCYTNTIGTYITGPSGTTAGMYHGYPTGQTRPNLFGIKDWVQVQGFTITEPFPHITYFSLDEAPDPDNCKVKYVEAASLGAAPTITTFVSGC